MTIIGIYQTCDLNNISRVIAIAEENLFHTKAIADLQLMSFIV